MARVCLQKGILELRLLPQRVQVSTTRATTRLNPTRLMSSVTTLPTPDLCDRHYDDLVTSGTVRVLHPLPAWQLYGKRRAFSGPISTVKVFEDNTLVRAALEQGGDGKVLIVDGGGSLRCALLGGNLAEIASKNGWAGLVVNGCVRDVEEINAADIGVRALASHPLKSFKRGQGQRDVPVVFGGLRILPGEWCYSDVDGILISTEKLSDK